LSSDLVANWVGALGSAGAAILAVVLWRMDRAATARRDNESREASRRGQAMHIANIVDAMHRQLEFLEKSTALTGGTTMDPEMLEIPAPDRVLDALRDPSAFSLDEIATVNLVVTTSTIINNRIRKNVLRAGDAEYVSTQSLDMKEIHSAIHVSRTCMNRLWAIATAQQSPMYPAID
jgi:hypothetical protein